MIDIRSFKRLNRIGQYYAVGDVVCTNWSGYALARIDDKPYFRSMLEPIERCVGTYILIDPKTGRHVCKRNIMDCDLKVLGFEAWAHIDGLVGNDLTNR